jgi:hypothetical protein
VERLARQAGQVRPQQPSAVCHKRRPARQAVCGRRRLLVRLPLPLHALQHGLRAVLVMAA